MSDVRTSGTQPIVLTVDSETMEALRLFAKQDGNNPLAQIQRAITLYINGRYWNEADVLLSGLDGHTKP